MDDMEKEKELQDEEVSGREEETAERREAASILWRRLKKMIRIVSSVRRPSQTL